MSKGKRRRGKRKGKKKKPGAAAADAAGAEAGTAAKTETGTEAGTEAGAEEPKDEGVKAKGKGERQRPARESAVDEGWGDPEELPEELVGAAEEPEPEPEDEEEPEAAEAEPEQEPEPEPEPEPEDEEEPEAAEAEPEQEPEPEPEDEDDDDEPGLRRETRIPTAVAADRTHAPPAGVLELRRIDELVGKLELVAVSLFLLSLIGVAVYQFIASKVLKTNDNWPFEVIRYSVFFVAMSAAALASQQKKMMAIDFIPRLMKPKTRLISRIIIALLVAFVCYLFIRGGLMVRASIAKTNEAYDVVNPVTGALALPIGAGLIGFHFLTHAVIDILYLKSGRMPPDDEGISVH